jgi:hypothetical protein
MKLFPRAATALLVFALALAINPFELNWSGIRWGTAPEWIAAFALLAIAAGVWRLAYVSGRREHERYDDRAEVRIR